jgi:hypothetical protein
MRALGAILFVSAAAAACAGDPPAPPADSISAAKKDFSAIKASGLPTDAAPMVPSLEMKEIGPIPGGGIQPTPLPVNDPLTLDPAKKRTGTGNWLLDAMDANSEASRGSPTGDDLARGGADLIRNDERLGGHIDRSVPSSRDSREKAEAKEIESRAFNPLDSFMAGWISSRDHDLLLSSAKPESLAPGEVPKARFDVLPGLEVAPPAGGMDGSLPSPEAASWADAKATVNPYLAIEESAVPAPMKVFMAPEFPSFAPDTDPYVVRGPSLSGVDPGSVDSPRSFIPDFAQPAEDDKYFKQLKRF